MLKHYTIFHSAVARQLAHPIQMAFIVVAKETSSLATDAQEATGPGLVSRQGTTRDQ